MRPKMHYGWVICGCCLLLLFLTMGTVSNGFSVYLPYLIERRGLSHSQASFLVTLRCLTALLAMLGVARYYARLSLRRGMSLAAVFAALAFLLYGVGESYPLSCLAAGVSGLSYGFGSMIPVAVLIARWFTRRRALAMGVCGAGSGLATVILPPLLTACLEKCSLRETFLWEGALIFLACLLLYALLRDTPAEKGLRPYGETAPAAADETAAEPSRPLCPAAFRLLALVSVAMGALANPGVLHLGVLNRSSGASQGKTAALLSLLGVMLVLGKLFYGWVTDAIGGRRSSLLFSLLLLGGHLLCCLAFLQRDVLDGAAMLLLGLGYPITTIGFSVWAGDLVSRDCFAAVVRRLQVIYAAGALVFAGLPGVGADLWGSYLPTFLFFSLLLLFVPGLVLLAYRRQAQATGGECGRLPTNPTKRI